MMVGMVTFYFYSFKKGDERMINWNASRFELELISKIAKRAKEDVFNCTNVSVMDLVMDVEATHCNGNPLKLDELLNSDRGNFLHDVTGIYHHINRKTGKLEDCFSPRYSL